MQDTAHLPIEDRPLGIDQRLWRWKVLISTYFAYAGFYLVRKVFSLCKTTLAKDYGFDYTSVADIWTAFLVAYMLGQFINGFIGRKWGPRVLLLGGLGLSMVFSIACGFANSYYTFLAFMMFNGLAQAAGWPGCVGGVAEWLRRRERGTIMGFWSTNYVIGNIAAKMVGGAILQHYSTLYGGHFGVRYTFFGCTLLSFAIWWLIYFWQRNKPEDVGLEPIVDHEHPEDRVVVSSTREHAGFAAYAQLFLNPIVPTMGFAYFSIKFLRYTLDSWLPTFLALHGMDVGRASYYSSIFDFAGFAGAIFAGFAVDRIVRSRWEIVCLVMGCGLVMGYLTVLKFGSSPAMLAICFGLVGFMLYGPDTLLSGAAAVGVAGQRNAVAVAGLVNGLGSIGPIVQEQVNGRILQSHSPDDAVLLTNRLGLSISILFVVATLVMSFQAYIGRRQRSRLEAEQFDRIDDRSESRA